MAIVVPRTGHGTLLATTAHATPPPPVNAPLPRALAQPLADDDAALVASLRAEAGEVDVDDGFPTRSIEFLRNGGWLLPERAHADGRNAGRRPSLFDRLASVGRGSLPVGRIYEGHVNAMLLVEAYGSSTQRARYAVEAADGHLFAVWNTEAAGGVTLRRVAGGVELQGGKAFCTAAGHATRAVVTGNDDDRARWMVVVDLERAAPALDRSFWRPLGMRPTASAAVDFSGVRVAADEVLGGPNDYYREPMFSTGAARFAAVQLGGAEAVFDETRAFLRRVGRTDDPYQRARLGEMAMRVASGRHWVEAAAARFATDAPARPARDAADVAFVHLMRTAIEDVCLRVLQLAERSVGARGLLRPEPFERMHRDLTHYLRQGAPDASLAAAGAWSLAQTESAADLFRA